jgi:hypothetical protein
MNAVNKDLVHMTREAQTLCKELEDLRADENAAEKLYVFSKAFYFEPHWTLGEQRWLTSKQARGRTQAPEA